MQKAGKRYSLVIYTRMVDRWWPAVLLLGLALLALAWPLYRDLFLRLAQPWRWKAMAGLGGVVILISLGMASLRKNAYVQPFSDHLRLVTPFLRMNISFRRIRRTTTASLSSLFPPRSVTGWKREIVEPLGQMTAVIVELNAYPIQPAALRFFLSPFFFRDKTPHFVFLVENWMGFSAELESMRVNGSLPEQKAASSKSILSQLPKK